MPVDSRHKQYDANSAKWDKCRVVVAGEDAVKAAGSKYLPMLGGQDTAEYEAYVQRAMFFAGSARTVDALVGMVFRKDPKIEYPKSRIKELDTISANATPLEVFAKKTVEEVFEVGRYGVLLEMPAEESVAALPYLCGYTTESILDWHTDIKDGRQRLTQVRLAEKEVSKVDDFEVEEKEIIRVLSLSSGEDGKSVYTQQKYLKTTIKEDGKEIVEWVKHGSEITPKVRGVALDYIPFVFINVKSLSFDVEKPPILDMANVNLSLYRTSADLEHGRHFTGLPTAWVAGFKLESKLSIGSTIAWVSEEPNAHAGYLEFTGQGLQSLENAVKEKKEYMAILGARLLESDKTGVEAAETLKTRKSSEGNVVASVAGTVEQGMNKVLEWYKDWAGISSSEVKIEFNKDYTNVTLDPMMINSLMAAVQQGTISFDTFFHNMKKGELYPDGRTMDEEFELIELGGPMKKGGPAMDLDDPDEEEEEEFDENGKPIKKKPPEEEEEEGEESASGTGKPGTS